MAKAKILVVEDEGIAAEDIKSSLEGMGYEVPATAFRGNEAIAKAEELRPDLVLMDIMLKGDMDGIEAAEQIRSRFGIPSIYLTAYADEEILQRVKITESYGYIIKPYVDRELRSNIEIALYRIETERELQFRAEMLDNTADSITVSDLDGNMVYVNETACLARGYSKEEFQGMTTFELITPEEAMHFHERVEEILAKGHVVFDTEIYHKNGAVIPVEMHSRIIEVAGQKLVLNVIRDTTERKKAEEKLKLRAYLLDSVTDAVVLRAKDGRTLYANRAAYANRGYSQDEFMKLHPEDFMSSEEAKAFRQIFIELEDKEYNIYHYKVFGKNGKAIPLETYARLVEINNEWHLLTVSRDITERKKAEEALRSSEERLRLFMDSATDAFSIWDSKLNLVDCNEVRMKRYFKGLRKEEVIGKNIQELFPHFGVSDSYEQYLEILRTGKPLFIADVVQFEDSLSLPESEQRHQEVRAFKVGDGLGVINTDTTERRKAEKELRANEQELEMLLKYLPGMVFYKDINFRYRRVNPAFTQLQKIAQEEIIGKTIGEASLLKAELSESDDRELVESGQVSSRIAEFPDETGGSRWQKIAKVPIQDENGKICGILGVGVDISDIIKAEEELKLRAEMLDQSENCIILLDLNGNCIYGNEVVLEERGYTQEEFLKLNVRDLVVLPGGGSFDEWWQQVVEKGHFRGEFEVRRKDGSLIPVEATARRAKSGEKEYVISVVQDITERKRMEAERLELERKAQVASRLASVGEMASGVAHEINNPLTGVVGFAQLLSEREDLPEDVREELKIVHEGGQRVSNIIKGLLSFARQSKPKRIYVDINEVIEGTIRLRQYELTNKNIEVIRRFAPELPWTMADAGQLQQVFMNLVVNAEQEMSTAHGKGRLEVKTKLAGDMIRISFKDDGPGIAKENIERIFDPFFTTKEVGKGTGLGLSLSHGIVVEHGGQLYAESKSGEGATFVVELPLLVEEGVEKAEAVTKAEKVVRGKILVVDDEEVVRQYLDSVLTKMGHSVELVADGEEALERVRTNRYGLILSDIKMPGMSGSEVYRRLGEIAPSITERVVFITGDVMGAETRDFILKTGAVYVTKPFDVDRLSWVVNNVLGGSKG